MSRLLGNVARPGFQGRGRALENQRALRTTLVLVILISAITQAQTATPGWPQWRGPQRDGTVTTPLPTTWPEKLTKKWELTVGEGHSSPVVSGDRVVIHAREGDKEITRAVSLGTGKELWRSEFAAIPGALT